VFAFLYLPILLLIGYSFNENRNVGIWTGFSTRWYGEMFQNSDVMRALRNTLIVALVSTVVSTVLGTMAAIAMERFRFRGRGTLDGLLYLPIIIPDVTMAVMMLLFFAQAFDLIGGFRPLNFGLGTIALSHIAFNISFVAVVVRARLSQLDGALEEAAADLYADRWQAFRRVTLPLIMPGVVGGALLALTLSLDDVVVTSFVSGPGIDDAARVRVRAGAAGCDPAHQRREHRDVGSVDGSRRGLAAVPARQPIVRPGGMTHEIEDSERTGRVRVLGLVVAACGGGDDEPDGGTSRARRASPMPTPSTSTTGPSTWTPTWSRPSRRRPVSTSSSRSTSRTRRCSPRSRRASPTT
jgi:spermidine/putrescine transport system permease protein